MLTFVAIVHVVIAVGLILFVLLQDPKGGGAAGVFGGGGGSNSLFGATGAGNFLTATTKWLAVLFALSCVLLTWMLSHKTTSVMDGMVSPTTPVEGTTQPAPAGSPAVPMVEEQQKDPTPAQAAPGETAPAPAESPAK